MSSGYVAAALALRISQESHATSGLTEHVTASPVYQRSHPRKTGNTIVMIPARYVLWECSGTLVLGVSQKSVIVSHMRP